MDSQKPIQFAQVQTEVGWLDFITANFALQSDRVRWLRDFGCLYLNQKRWQPNENETLKRGDLVRVHLQPRRFPIEFLQDRNLHEISADWVLVWKPHGIPTHESLDNLVENAKAWSERKLGQKLRSLNRLDVGTRGWVLFARTAEFAAHFHTALEYRRVQKFYETLSTKPSAAPGLWRHWMKKSDRSPREVSSERQSPSDLVCELTVLEQSFLPKAFVRSRVELLTGRTHQIRAQFAANAAPLLGDRMYGSTKNFGEGPGERFALSHEELIFDWQEKRVRFTRPFSEPPLTEALT